MFSLLHLTSLVERFMFLSFKTFLSAPSTRTVKGYNAPSPAVEGVNAPSPAVKLPMTRCYHLDFRKVHRDLKKLHTLIEDLLLRLTAVQVKQPHIPATIERIRVRLNDIYSVEAQYAKMVQAMDDLPEDGILPPLSRGEYLFYRAVQNYFYSSKESVINKRLAAQGLPRLELVDDLNDDEEGPQNIGAVIGRERPRVHVRRLQQSKDQLTRLILDRTPFDPTIYAGVLDLATTTIGDTLYEYKIRFLSHWKDLHEF